MGSSPFTATIDRQSSPDTRSSSQTDEASSSPLGVIEASLARHAVRDARIVLAFSGGPDSTALAIGLRALANRRRLRLQLVHVDHGLDEGSAERAAAAAHSARALGLPFASERLQSSPVGESLEAFARRKRYAILAKHATASSAKASGVAWVVTAHHADDQAETVLLRVLFGSGLAGLRGIAERTVLAGAQVLRPALALRRPELLSLLGSAPEPAERDADTPGAHHSSSATARWIPTIDPTNFDLARPRNRIRHRLVPELTRDDPRVVERLLRLAFAARAADRRLTGMLSRHLRLQPEGADAYRGLGAPAVSSMDRHRLAALPDALMPFALALAHRSVGRPLPPSAKVREEIVRQIRTPGPVRVDGAAGSVWQGDSRRIWLLLREDPAVPFAYTLRARKHGRTFQVETTAEPTRATPTPEYQIDIPEASCRLLLRRAPRADWMLRADPRRVAFTEPVDPESFRPETVRPESVDLEPADPEPAIFPGRAARPVSSAPNTAAGHPPRFTIRTRRRGDSIRPFGHGSNKTLQSLLVDHRIPRHHRDRLPLLVWGDRIVWVPGVTLDDRFRLRSSTPDTAIWTAELLPLLRAESTFGSPAPTLGDDLNEVSTF